MDIEESDDRATAASAGSLAYESRLRRPERRTCILTPPTSLEMTHYHSGHRLDVNCGGALALAQRPHASG